MWRLAVGPSPAILATFFVLLGFVANAIPLAVLWRPLAICILLALVIQACLVRWLGWGRGSLWSFVVVSALAGMFVVAGSVAFALISFGFVRSAPGRDYELAGALTSVGAGVLLVGLLVIGQTRDAFEWDPIATQRIELQSGSVGPSIHLLVVDGYPRQDVLRDIGFDNTPFLDGLRNRGFDVYEDSHSNYARTPFSMLSMLSLRHLSDIDPLWSSTPADSGDEQRRIVARALMDAPVFAALEQAGYSTRALTSTIVHVPIGGADVTVTPGGANNFELSMLQRTPLAGLLEALGFAAGQQRTNITQTLEAFGTAPEEPTFTIAHVMAPHAPFVFGTDGAPASAPPCYPATCALFDHGVDVLGWSSTEYWQRMTGHLQYINELVLRAADRLITDDPEAIVIITSDHGVDGDTDDVLYRNLITARTPGHPHLLGVAPTPVNLMIDVLNAYLDADLPRQPDTLYRSGRAWLSVEPIPPADLETH